MAPISLYLESPEWHELAEAAKKRFGHRCALCNTDPGLQAHHRTYDRVGGELVEDLTALCGPLPQSVSRVAA
jgi:hypothetical protein